MDKSWWSSLLNKSFSDITLWIMYTYYLRMTLRTRGRIIEAVGSVQKRILTRTWAELVFQVYVVRTTRGSQVDVG